MYDGCLIDFDSATLSLGSSSVQLPGKALNLFKLLILHHGETLSRQLAIDTIWGLDSSTGGRGIDQALLSLRGRFKDIGADANPVKTIPKIGFYLTKEPTPVHISVLHEKEKGLDFYKTTMVICVLLSCIATSLYIKNSFVPSYDIETHADAYRETNLEGSESQVDISHDGINVAFVRSIDSRPPQIYMKKVGGVLQEVNKIGPSLLAQGSPSFSPDGLQLAYFEFPFGGGCRVNVFTFLSNTTDTLAKDCFEGSYRKNLSWSPDGRALAYSSYVGDHVSIVLFDIETNAVSSLTESNGRGNNYMPTWSSDSRHVAYVNERSGVYSLNVMDRVGLKNSVIKDDIGLALGLTWDYKLNNLIYAAKDGALFSIFTRGIVSGKEVTLISENSISGLEYSFNENSVYYSHDTSKEYISHVSFGMNKELSRIASSSRDIFGGFLPVDGSMLFMSNRSGFWDFWVKLDGVSRKISNNEGVFSLPASSPLSDVFVVPIKLPGTLEFQMYINELDGSGFKLLFEMDGGVRDPVYSHDGSRLFFSARTDEGWCAFSYTFSSSERTLMFCDDVRFIVDNEGHGFYYSKGSSSGIFYYDLASKNITLVTSALSMLDWGAFYMSSDGLVYLKRLVHSDRIFLILPNGSEVFLTEFPSSNVGFGRGIVKGGSNSVVITRQGVDGSDLYQIEL